MTLLDYQTTLARLIVDQDFRASFAADRDRVLASLDIAGEAAEWLAALDLDEVRTFSDIVTGSRATRYELIFGELRSRMTAEAWRELLSAFHREVVVLDSNDRADLGLFCEWLESRAPGTRASALASYGRVLQELIAAVPTASGPVDRWRLVSGVAAFACPFDLDEMLESSAEDLWHAGDPGASRHYVLHADNGDDVEMFEVTEDIAELVHFLAVPRLDGEVAAFADGAALAALVDAELALPPASTSAP